MRSLIPLENSSSRNAGLVGKVRDDFLPDKWLDKQQLAE